MSDAAVTTEKKATKNLEKKKNTATNRGNGQDECWRPFTTAYVQ